MSPGALSGEVSVSTLRPLRDVGLLESGVDDSSRNVPRGRGLEREGSLLWLPMFAETESARFRPGGLVTLQRLTLSLLFIMALWTKPPKPLVGEPDRIGEPLPLAGSAEPSAGDVSFVGYSNRGGLSETGEAKRFSVGLVTSAFVEERWFGVSADMPGS